MLLYHGIAMVYKYLLISSPYLVEADVVSAVPFAQIGCSARLNFRAWTSRMIYRSIHPEEIFTDTVTLFLTIAIQVNFKTIAETS